MASPAFVHLDVRSFFSLKDGAFSPEDLARRVAGLGMLAVALTDRDGLYGTARFVDACQKAGVKPILGGTLTVRDPSLHRFDPLAAPGVDAEGFAPKRGAEPRVLDPELAGAPGEPR